MRTCDIIRNLRESRHLSQLEMSRRSGISQATISAVEVGSRQPSMEMLEKFANFFGVPKSTLVGDDQPAESVQVIAEAIQKDASLLKLFDIVRYMRKEDIDAVIVVAKALADKNR